MVGIAEIADVLSCALPVFEYSVGSFPLQTILLRNQESGAHEIERLRLGQKRGLLHLAYQRLVPGGGLARVRSRAQPSAVQCHADASALDELKNRRGS